MPSYKIIDQDGTETEYSITDEEEKTHTQLTEEIVRKSSILRRSQSINRQSDSSVLRKYHQFAELYKNLLEVQTKDPAAEYYELFYQIEIDRLRRYKDRYEIACHKRGLIECDGESSVEKATKELENFFRMMVKKYGMEVFMESSLNLKF